MELVGGSTELVGVVAEVGLGGGGLGEARLEVVHFGVGVTPGVGEAVVVEAGEVSVGFDQWYERESREGGGDGGRTGRVGRGR